MNGWVAFIGTLCLGYLAGAASVFALIAGSRAQYRGRP